MNLTQFNSWVNWLEDPANQSKQAYGHYFPVKNNTDKCCAWGGFLLANNIPVRYHVDIYGDGFEYQEPGVAGYNWQPVTFYPWTAGEGAFDQVTSWNDGDGLTFAQIAARLKQYRYCYVWDEHDND